MPIPAQLVYDGKNKEFQFRDKFVMPLLLRLGFGIVLNYHGPREFGRDVVFGDIDRFGHVVYYGMQIKYEASISLSGSHSLIQDTEEATNTPFKHPQTGRVEFISCFYIANAGDFSDQAMEHFFHGVAHRGIRDARLLNGNALILLDKAASLNRNADVKERLVGLLQEVRVNRNLVTTLVPGLQAFVDDTANKPFPFLRFRNSASANYLNAPFPIPDLPINTVDQYWQLIRMLNDLADSIGVLLSAEEFRKGRLEGFINVASQLVSYATEIERVVMALLTQLNGVNSL